MKKFTYNPTNHWLSGLLLVGTLCLIFLGGMVTTKGAGLAVPDWPTSYGTLNPPNWFQIENVRLEHGHRLLASGIGLITIFLTISLWKTESRRWVKCLGIAALAGVILQGVLGGLRVIMLSTPLAVVHACVAQAFFCLVLFLMLITSRRWDSYEPIYEDRGIVTLKPLALLLGCTIYIQLILGAVMRHMQAGLAIPDFPKSFGRWIPDLTAMAVKINYSHRVGALVVTLLVLLILTVLIVKWRKEKRLLAPGLWLGFFLLVQVGLGVHIIILGRPAFITTAHVMVGALVLGTSFLLIVRSRCLIKGK